MPPHRIFFCFKKIFFFGDKLIFLPQSNPPLPPQKYMHFQYRPWCFPLKGIRVSTELFIKNFFLWWSPHQRNFRTTILQKGTCNSNGNSILPLCSLPTFPTSPHSHLSQVPNLTTLLPFPNSQTHYPPSTIKVLQNNNIRSSLSTLVFKRRFTLSELKSKVLILPSREMISDH